MRHVTVRMDWQQGYTDTKDGREWSADDLEDLRLVLTNGGTIEDAAAFLSRSGTLEDVRAKARELGLVEA
jgi:hypothetical protein